MNDFKEQFYQITKIHTRPVLYIKKCKPELYQKYLELLKSEYNNQAQIMLFELKHLHEIPVCKICGKPVGNNGHKFYDFCSYECRAAGADYEKITSKYKQTCLKKYGVDNVNKLSTVREKIYNTCEEKYGDKFVNKVDTIKEKKKQTCLEKYGVDSTFKSEQIKNKIKQTNLQKYGSEYYITTEECKEHTRELMFEKYGVNHISQAQEIKDKKRDIALQKYGVKSPLQAQEIKDKIKHTNLQKYGVEYPQQNKEIAKKRGKTQTLQTYDSFSRFKDICIPLFTKDEYIGASQTRLYKWKCVNCGQEFESIYANGLIPTCEHCKKKYGSLMQKELIQFVRDELHQNIVINTRKVIYPLELDIYIPEKQIAIEFNGMFYHSSNFVDKNYHLHKTKQCEQQGIHLIHIWEYDWICKKEIIKNRLKNLLGIYDKTIYARKCIVNELDSNVANTFLQENHLQGKCSAKVYLGLMYENELVSVITFGQSRFNKRFQWELIRYASKYHVIGGAGKLLKYFERRYQPTTIISYADRCWSQGNLYKQLGFELKTEASPNYVYVNGSNTNNMRILTRYQCQKHKLGEMLGGKFNPNLTESQNMENAHYFKVYDCGNFVFCK